MTESAEDTGKNGGQSPRVAGVPTMTKAERDELGGLVRKRAKLLKLRASQRKAELSAEFEEQMATIHSYNQNDVWRRAYAAADEAVAVARQAIAEECRKLGIPDEFAPRLSLDWYGRGENAAKERRIELRKVAMTRLDAMEKAAHVAIETDSLALQTELAVNGLTSPAARAFLEGLGPIEAAMPRLEITEIETLMLQQRRRRRYLGDPL